MDRYHKIKYGVFIVIWIILIFLTFLEIGFLSVVIFSPLVYFGAIGTYEGFKQMEKEKTKKKKR